MTSIPTAERTPDFKFGTGERATPSTIGKVAKLDAYLVQYYDGTGKEEVRICFRIPNSNATFIMQAKISGTNVATPAHEWFHKALTAKLDKGQGGEVQSV